MKHVAKRKKYRQNFVQKLKQNTSIKYQFIAE